MVAKLKFGFSAQKYMNIIVLVTIALLETKFELYIPFIKLAIFTCNFLGMLNCFELAKIKFGYYYDDFKRLLN